MEIRNAKLDWNLILKNYIEFVEARYPDYPVRKTFDPIIEKLSNNQLRSRVVIAGTEVAAYAYLLDSTEMPDRIYASVGFLNEKYYSAERLKNLVEWISSESGRDRKIPMLNEIFNATGEWEKVLYNAGFRRVRRTRMQIDLHKMEFAKIETPESIKILPFGALNPESYADFNFHSYLGTEDAILYSSTPEQSLATAKSLFNGEYGKIIQDASFSIYSGDKLSGYVVFTSGEGTKPGGGIPLLADITVAGDLRGKGIGKALLMRSLFELQRLGYLKAVLWVSDTNPATQLYKAVGFTDANQPDEIFFYIPRT
ncbi:MAG: GNAT family N-acetyltransferase [Thermoplasmataceae archaeon]